MAEKDDKKTGDAGKAWDVSIVMDGAAAPEEDAPKPVKRKERQRERFQTSVGFVHPKDR